VGIVSEGDLARHGSGGGDIGKSWWLASPGGNQTYLDSAAGDGKPRFAKDVMTREVLRAKEDASVEELAALLERHRIKRVPIERDGALVGLVSRANLVQALASGPGRASSTDGASIRAAILTALQQAGGPAHLVNVVFRDGTAYLWGAVDSRQQRDAVCAAAAGTPGVGTISDHLFILSERIRSG